MFTHDIVRHYGFHNQMSEKHQVLVGRLFVVGLLAITYILSLVSNRSIFKLAVWSFTGFASLFPVLLAALFWKRSTKQGAFASIVSVVVLWTFFFLRGWQTPGYTIGDSGIMPVTVVFATSAFAMVIVSLMTKPPEVNILRKFFATPSRIEPSGTNTRTI
jgi:SSS family solute:Na+ symporter